MDAGSSLRCSPSPSVITACLIRRKTIRNCSEMFGNDQVSEMFVPNTIFGYRTLFAQDVFYRTFFIYRLIWYDCNYICSKTCSKNWCTVVNFVSGSGSAGILSRNPSVGCHWNSIESLNTGIIFVAREYRFRVSVPGTSKIDQIAHFVSLRFCRFAKSFLTNLDELKHVRVIICVWILVQLKIGILQKKFSNHEWNDRKRNGIKSFNKKMTVYGMLPRTKS